jgi:hypothetical protein
VGGVDPPHESCQIWVQPKTGVPSFQLHSSSAREPSIFRHQVVADQYGIGSTSYRELVNVRSNTLQFFASYLCAGVTSVFDVGGFH